MTFAAELAAVQYAFLLGHPYDQPAWRCSTLLVAVGLSSDRSAIRLRTVSLAFALQAVIGFVALFTEWGIAALTAASEYVAVLLGYSRAGMEFMFGGLVGPSDSLGFIFAFSVLPVVIFFSSLIAVLYTLGSCNG